MNLRVTRNILYSLISSLELDLRHFIRTRLSHIPIDKLINNNIQLNILSRTNTSDIKSLPFDVLLENIDFPDTFQIINANSSELQDHEKTFFRNMTRPLEKLSSIRNTIMHSRTLDGEELMITFETINDFVSSNIVECIEISPTWEQFKKEPESFYNYNIPFIDVEPAIINNLPVPDFDETGFLGRKKEIEDIKKLLSGGFPVISILAGGGVGKSALALKVAYDLIESNSQFDAIIWSTSKTTKFNNTEIINLRDAITTSLGLFEYIANELSGNKSTNPQDEILYYLKEFKILLIIDNLETILDENFSNFISQIPPGGSRILITSRIGLGAFEYPYKLGDFSLKESVLLLKILCRLRNINSLDLSNESNLNNYCSFLYNNPLHIKYFVSAIQIGRRPEEILTNPEKILEFCMSNVYNYLSLNSHLVLNTFLTIPGSINQADLSFYSCLAADELQKALQQLLTTNMIIINNQEIYESTYELTEIARVYLTKHHQVELGIHNELLKKKRQLQASIEDNENTNKNKYSISCFSMRSKSDISIIRILKKALTESKRKNYVSAFEHIKEAKRLAPEFYEIYKIEGFILDSVQKYLPAKDAYLKAIKLEENSAVLYTWYGGFLMRSMNDYSEAILHFKKAIELDPNAFKPNFELSRCYLFINDFDNCKIYIEKIHAFSNLTDIDSRKLFDHHLEYFYRYSNHLISTKANISDIILNLSMTKYAYDQIPRVFIDDKIQKTLNKSLTLIKSQYDIAMNSVSLGSECKRIITELYNWVKDHELNKEYEDDFSNELLKSQLEYNKITKKGAFFIKNELLNNLKIYEKRNVTVTNITSFGVFLKVDDLLCGLLHRTNITGLPIKCNLIDYFSKNEPLYAEIINIDFDTQKIQFKYDHSAQEEFNQIVSVFNNNKLTSGVVLSINDNKITVKLSKYIKGYSFIRKGKINNFKLKQFVKCKIIEVDINNFSAIVQIVS